MVSFRPAPPAQTTEPTPSSTSSDDRTHTPLNHLKRQNPQPAPLWSFGALPACSACLGLQSSMKMSSSALLALLLCAVLLSVGSGLRCYRCHGYSTINCQNIQECSYEDSCLSLSEKGGKTIRQCIRYTDCENSRLTQMFPSVDGFTYRCCSSNLCNSAPLRASGATGLLMGALALGLLSCWGP